MATNPKKLSQFWQELKRRKVVHVITVYAGAAFVIIELVNNITEPLRLPAWTPTLMIIMLAVGFPVALIFSWIFDVTPEGIEKTKSPGEHEKRKETTVSDSWRVATYASIVIIFGLIAYNIFGGKKSPGIDESLERSIAVLPFHNFSGDPGQDYMCEGLTDEIISHLFRLKSFNEVRSLTSVLPYKDSEKSTTEIAGALHVNYILEGSYKRMGKDLKVTAQLIEAKSDNHIWLHDYELPYTEVMGIPGEIAHQIADHLKAFMTEEEQQSISSLPTENLEAYELIQQVKSIFNARPFENRPTIIDLAEKAIALDPDYADPYAWKGTMIISDGFFWGNKEMKSVAWDAEEYFDKALRIDPNNFMANWGVAIIDFFVRWDYVRLMEFSERFQDHLSSDVNINFANAFFWLKMGRLDEALYWTQQTNYTLPVIYTQIQILEGNTEYAREMIAKGIDSLGLPVFFDAAVLYTWMQDFDRALFCFDSLIAKGQDPGRWLPINQADLAVASFKTGHTDQARAMIGKLIARSDTTSVGSPDYFIGWYYSWIGEPDSAFYWLDEAVENRSPDLTWLKVDPAFNNLKNDPRYWSLYERTGFKAYDDYMASKNE
jgi:TolB-like protein